MNSIKKLNNFAKKNWFLLICLAIALILLIVTPHMIKYAVTECNKQWLAKYPMGLY